MLRTGLVISGLLGLIDAVGVFTTDGEHPPMSVAIIGTVIGLVTLAAIVPGWRGNRPALWTVVVTRVLSALSAVPVFFVGAPGVLVALVVVGIVLTVVAIALIVPSLRRSDVPVAVSS